MTRARLVAKAFMLLVGLLVGRLSAQEAPTVADSGFRAFLGDFNAGLTAMVNGDPTLWMASVSHADDVTLMTPLGANLRGWAAVGRQYEQNALKYAGGSTVHQDYVAAEALDDLGYTVVLQAACTGCPAAIRRAKASPGRRTSSGSRTGSGSWCTGTWIT